MKIYIVSDNDDFHCAENEQHIVKIFRQKKKAEELKELLESSGRSSYDVIEWEVE
jgi:hypothetical protein